MSLSIVVNGGGTFTASMEEGPVSFTASLGAVPGPKGDTGATGPAGVVAATAPILYNSGTQTVSIDSTPTFESVDVTDGVNTSGIYPDSIVFNDADVLTETSLVLNDGTNELSLNTTGITFPDATLQSTAFVGEARKVYITARNNTGTTIAKGKVVRLSGATGNHPTIALAQANTEGNSSRTIGITVEAIDNNAEGKVIISGAVENIDTSDFNAGDTVHLSSSVAGGLQLALPVAPLHGVVVGIVTRANPSVGSIEVVINNYQELEELSDILIASKANNDLLAWDSTGSVWKNKTFATLGLLTSATAASTYAPIASPTFTGTVTIPAGASISGFLTSATAASTYAPLASPTFSGTPSLPTGTIAVTQAAGNSTTAVATTAFVQQEVPAASTSAAGKVELATDAEAIAGTSATLAVTPKGVDEAFLFSGRRLYTTAFAASTSGTGATTGQASGDQKFIGAPTSVVGYALLRSEGALVQRGRAYNNGIDFSKRIVLAFRMALRTASTDANSVYRVTLGKDTTDNAGDLGLRGFGIKGISGSAVVLTVHNGTTLTDVNSTFTPSGVNSHDVELVSDGSGNVTLFINGSEVATTTAGPTNAGGTIDYNLQAEAENTSALSGSRMGFEIASLRATFSL